MPDVDIEQKNKEYGPISQVLAKTYGYPEWRPSMPPVDEMVSTILSQNTNDTNRDRGFMALKERFPTWEDVRDAPPKEVINAIRPAGLANQKGPRIQSALEHLTETQGEITLEFMRDMNVDDAKAWLTSIKGIGPKTAAIILLFAMGKPAFPVDTHVHRVSMRLGLINNKTSADKAHDILEEIVPEKDFYPFHLQMIQHGRQICHARSPECGRCPLQEFCAYFNALSDEEKAEKLAAT